MSASDRNPLMRIRSTAALSLISLFFTGSIMDRDLDIGTPDSKYCCRIWDRGRVQYPHEQRLRPIVPLVFYRGAAAGARERRRAAVTSRSSSRPPMNHGE